MKRIDILCPCYNEFENLDLLAKEIAKIRAHLASKYDCQLLLIDDGSSDGSQELIQNLTQNYDFISYIFFTRNFSHQNALLAGIHYSKADIIITMDADLQHPPAYIPQFIEKFELGFEIVNGVRKNTVNKFSLKILFSRLFYKIINRISDIHLEINSPDFRLYGSKVLKVLKNYNEKDLFLRGYVSWLGFSHCELNYEQAERHKGKSKYSFVKMMRLAVNGITSMTSKPLQWISFAGITMTFIPIIYGIYLLSLLLFHKGELVVGWLSIVMLLVFFQGTTFMFLGIMASYLSQIYNESKNRPNYIIKDSNI